jgi:hypothetical protein
LAGGSLKPDRLGTASVALPVTLTWGRDWAEARPAANSAAAVARREVVGLAIGIAKRWQVSKQDAMGSGDEKRRPS